MAIEKNEDGGNNAPRDRITADGMDEIGNPLAVLRGYIQLLQRRIHRGQKVDDAELIRVLGIMNEASHVLTEKLATMANPRCHSNNSKSNEGG